MRLTLWLVALAFGIWSLWVMAQVGYLGIWQGGFANLGAAQITVDLVVSSLLLMGFVVRDCRAAGRPWWPWAVITAFAGSFGTLAYLLWPRRGAGA
jgi:hypothetical protein